MLLPVKIEKSCDESSWDFAGIESYFASFDDLRLKLWLTLKY